MTLFGCNSFPGLHNRNLANPITDDQGVFGGVVVTSDFLQVHGLEGDDKTATLGTVVAIYDIGCFIGAIAAAWVGEMIGRKRSILLGTAIMAIGAILQITSFSLGQMYVGRVVAGIGNGVNTATVSSRSFDCNF